jgi:PAS domain S-box-containing protein
MTDAAHEALGYFDLYRAFADAIPQIIWSAHADGSLDFLNHAWCEYSGAGYDEAMSAGWTEALHPDDFDATIARWYHSRDTGEPYEMEYRLRGRDGTYRWFVARGKPMLDASGAVLRWYGGVTDIDDLKKAEAAVLRSATVFRNLADSLPQIVWVADATGCNTYLNRRWYEYTGIDPSSVHSLQAVAHPDDFESTMEAWREAVALGAIFETEYRLKRHDGTFRWFLGRAFPARAPDGTVSDWFGSCTDIEDRKRTEAEIMSAYEREHRIAATLQRAFLAHDMPDIDGLTFDAIYRPAEREAEVGGDWYDAIALDDGRVVISIGDVAGHGLDAAVVMGNVRQAIRVVAQVVESDPVAILDAVDRTVRRESPETMVTAFVGIIDPGLATLAFASAGHPPPLLYADGAISQLLARGLPLGLRKTGVGRSETIALPRSGLLMLYTDGLLESTRNIETGERRLREALAAANRDNAAHPAKFVQERVLFDGARDDVAVLTVAFHQTAASAPERRRGD